MKYLLVLGRQPEISRAELAALGVELERICTGTTPEPGRRNHGRGHTYHLGFTANPRVLALKNRLGGTIKIAERLTGSPLDYLDRLDHHKLVFGLSDFAATSPRAVHRDALELKEHLLRRGHSVRVVANQAAVLTSATILKNGLLHPEKGRAELVRYQNHYYVTRHEQNITAYARRDQNRPARDARVGMLPPKLAQILINLCGDLPQGATLLDPFCGTGVVLQEAELMGLAAYGSDLSGRMIDYARTNLTWLYDHWFLPPHLPEPRLEVGDATSHTWRPPVDAVASEVYLGPPLTQAPSEAQLRTLQSDARELVRKTLVNLGRQLTPGTPVVLAAPAWLRPGGGYVGITGATAGAVGVGAVAAGAPGASAVATGAPETTSSNTAGATGVSAPDFSVDFLAALGYNQVNYSEEPLIYRRAGQVVAREIIVLRKSNVTR